MISFVHLGFVLLLVICLYLIIRIILNGGVFTRNCCHIKTMLHGKTVVITGGNAGIGKQTAIDLARRGARVIIACRNETKAKKAIQDIRRESGSSNVHYSHLELSDQDSIRKFAKTFLEEEQRLDILINNAGLVQGVGPSTKQGYDMTFGVNHFGHFLLTMLLLDRLKECSPSRIVTVSSKNYLWVKGRKDMDFSSGALVNSEVKYPGLSGYDRSKLANILFTLQLSKHLRDTGVTTFSLHPGLVRTNIFQTCYESGAGSLLRYLLASLASILFGLSEEAGAQTSIYCAIEESIADKSGGYFENCQLTSVKTKLGQDDWLAKKIWDVSCQATGIDQ